MSMRDAQSHATAPTTAGGPQPRVEAASGIPAAVAFLIVEVLALLLGLAACAAARPGPTATPQPRRTATPQPTPQPTGRPAVRWLPLVEPRDVLAAPAAPEINFGRTRAIPHLQGNFDEDVLVGAELWTDLHLFWTHLDPVQVDYYEVWKATNEPYWTPTDCVSCTLALTTTGQRGVFPESPARFNPLPGTANYMPQSDFDFYLVRAVNTSGASEESGMVGIVNYPLGIGPDLGGGGFMDFPTPPPTAGPSPTPTHTPSPTPQGSVTPGPSPTP